MQKRKTRLGTAVFTGVLLLVLNGAVSQQVARKQSAPILARLSAVDLVQQKSGLGATLPKDATRAVVQDAQAMSVNGEVDVVPVSYQVPLPDAVIAGAMKAQCGVYVAAKASTATFVPTVGMGNTETVECRDMAAIGAATQTAHPNLILVYHTHTIHQDSLTTILLVWNGKTKTYAVDDALSQWLGEQKQGHTVTGARRLLAQKASGSGTGA